MLWVTGCHPTAPSPPYTLIFFPQSFHFISHRGLPKAAPDLGAVRGFREGFQLLFPMGFQQNQDLAPFLLHPMTVGFVAGRQGMDLGERGFVVVDLFPTGMRCSEGEGKQGLRARAEQSMECAALGAAAACKDGRAGGGVQEVGAGRAVQGDVSKERRVRR